MALNVAYTRHLTGIDLTPFQKTGLLWTPQVGLVVSRDALQGEGGLSVGAFTVANQISVAMHENSVGGVNPASNDESFRDDCITQNRNGNINNGRIARTSIDSDGYTLTPTTAYGTTSPLHVLALGGLTEGKVGTFALNTVVGQQLVDLGVADADAVIFFLCSRTAINTSGSTVRPVIGWATRYKDGGAGIGQGVLGMRARHGVYPGETAHIVRTDACIASIAQATLTEAVRVSLTGFTATGLDLEIEATDASPLLVGYVLLKGLYAVSGVTAMRADTNDQPFASGGSPIKALLLGMLGGETATMAAPATGVILGLGMGISATERGAIGSYSPHGGTNIPKGRESSVRALIEPGPTNIVSDMDLKSLDPSDGGVLDQVIAASLGHLVPFLGFGDAITSTATHLGLVAEPAAALSGKPFQAQVRLLGAGDVPVQTAGVAVTVSKQGGTGTLSGTLTRNTDTQGIATFDDLELAVTTGNGNNTLQYTSLGGTAVLASGGTIAVASTIAITTQPSGTAVSNVLLAQQPVVRFRDPAGNNISLPGITVRASIASGGGALAGTSDRDSDASGIVSYSTLKIVWSSGSATHKLAFDDVEANAGSPDTTDIVVSAGSGGGVASPFGEGVFFL